MEEALLCFLMFVHRSQPKTEEKLQLNALKFYFQVLVEKTWWSTSCRRGPMFMPGTMEDLSPYTMPAHLVTQKLSASFCVRGQTPMLETTGTTLRCMRQPSRERLMFALVRMRLVMFKHRQLCKSVMVFKIVLV